MAESYAVIGSNCFTGSHIVDALLAETDAPVVGISRSPEYDGLFLPYRARDTRRFTFRQIDLVHRQDDLQALLDEVRPRVVINVAALSEVGLSNELPIEYFETNTLGVVKLCDHLRRQSYLERYIHISSAEIFGSLGTAADESTLFNPSTPYAVSKAAADQYLNTLIKNFGFPATLIRSTNVYGRHQQLFKIIPRTAIYLKMGRLIELHGGGTAKKSFVHIRDVVHGLLLTLSRGSAGTYHFSVPSDDTVADVVRMVCERMGRDFEDATRVVGERLGQDARYWLDCSKAERELGWRPQVSMAQGIAETVDWVEANWDAIQRHPLEYIHKVQPRELAPV